MLIDGTYYYAGAGGKLVTDRAFWTSNTNDLLPQGTYRADAEGKIIMTTEIVQEGDVLYYYQDGKRTASVGLVLFNGDYYYIDGAANAVVDQSVSVSKTNGLLQAGTYYFGADGKLVFYNGIVDGYYYVEGLRSPVGLFEVDDSYYYAGDGGKITTDSSFWISKTNDLVPAGTYRADAEGKLIMTTEIVKEGDVLYYYENGKRTASAGLVEFDGSYYYIDSAAKAVVGRTIWVSKTNGLMEVGAYTFDEEGKMIL